MSRIARKELDNIVLDFEEEQHRSHYGCWYEIECGSSNYGMYSPFVSMKEGWLFVHDIVPYEEFNCKIENAFESK